MALFAKVLLFMKNHPKLSAFLAIMGSIGPILTICLFMFFAVTIIDKVDSGNSNCSGGNSTEEFSNVSGTGGDWTQKGTKAHNIAKSVYSAAKAQGCNNIKAASVTGNAAHESWRFEMGLHVHQVGGGPGVGIFQFNNPPKDMSPSGQVKAIFANAPGQKSKWEHSSGGISDSTNSFEKIFERGGVPDNSIRDQLAMKAYKMFSGIKGSAGSDDADSTASASNCDNSSSDNNIISFGSKYLGLKYESPPKDISPIVEGKPKSKAEPVDCSAFVYAVLKHCGYKVPQSKWATGSEITSKDLKTINKKNVQPGDVVVVNGGPGNGHTAFIDSTWKNDDTKILQEGTSSSKGACVNFDTLKDGFYSDIPRIKDFRFAEPIKD